ncbi:mannose-6-phosphate isomerase [Obba rivulosa]|uniref:Mannose-6-phosphate isomerase n=1 Tax=Obba rivulosa TaxID=1052685 RepID=A0A8E2B2K5_9APHY|nr:mannose-6-phosphate isomerase [Obba rivulosa]
MASPGSILVSPPNLIRLKAAPNNYEWGKIGRASLVSQLAPNAVGPDFKLDESKPYSELWMGTHPHGPAHLFDSPSIPLQRLITASPTPTLGGLLVEKWPQSQQLPFLFKILSIQKALPLQIHPDKRLAEELHAEDPAAFADDNHKPEIAVAIGPPLRTLRDRDPGAGAALVCAEDQDAAFTGFVGFRPLAAIRTFLLAVPELWRAVGDDALVDSFITIPSPALLRRVFGALLTRPDGAEAEVRALYKRVRENVVVGRGAGAAIGRGEDAEEAGRLVLKVGEQYPGDVGMLACVFCMNYVKLKKGEAVYIGADEVHAYLEGDIVECMATSDNVLNAGFVDPAERRAQVPTFIRALSCTARPASHWALPAEPYAHSRGDRTRAYRPPLEEFVVLGTTLSAAVREERFGPARGPMVGIVVKGTVRVATNAQAKEEDDEEMRAAPGTVVFVRPGNGVQMELVEGEEGEVWWAAWGV